MKKLLLLPLMLILLGCDETPRTANSTEVGIDSKTTVEEERSSTPDDFDAAFADGMTAKVFQNYLHLRSALTESDPGAAATAADNLAESFLAERAGLRARATAIAELDDLEAQRVEFALLTAELEPLFEEGLSGGTYYKQYCPMAFDGEGAEWFSDAEEIRNPYFGDRMLSCGKVVQTYQ